jgi:MFS family permease
MHNRWLIAVSAGLICFMGFASRGAFGIFFVEMLKEYPWDRASLAGVYSVGMLVMGFGGALAGSLSQKLGPKRYFFLGGTVLGLTFVLASQAQTLTQIYLTYGLLGGVSLAMLGLGPTQGLVARWFETQRGLAIGLVAAGLGAYPLLAPLVQVVVEAFGWRRGMIYLGVLSFLIVTALGVFVIKEPPGETSRPAKGPTEQASRPGSAHWTLRKALKSGPAWLIGLAWLFMSVAIHFVNSQLIPLLVGLGYSALLASGVLAVSGACSVVNRAVGGVISDSLGRVRTFNGGVLLSAAGFLILWFHQGGDAVWPLYAFAVLFGLGTGAQTTQTTSLAADIYRGPYFAGILGFISIGFGLGGALGPWLAGWVFEWTGSYSAMIWCALLSLACGSVCMMEAGREIRKIREKGALKSTAGQAALENP